ncbi:hypothetical protein LINGRAHAP2_LOCUS4266, partial [Linum grandiflorum]
LILPSSSIDPSLTITLSSSPFTTHDGDGGGIAAFSSSPARRWPHGLSLSPAFSLAVLAILRLVRLVLPPMRAPRLVGRRDGGNETMMRSG